MKNGVPDPDEVSVGLVDLSRHRAQLEGFCSNHRFISNRHLASAVSAGDAQVTVAVLGRGKVVGWAVV